MRAHRAARALLSTLQFCVVCMTGTFLSGFSLEMKIHYGYDKETDMKLCCICNDWNDWACDVHDSIRSADLMLASCITKCQLLD